VHVRRGGRKVSGSAGNEHCRGLKLMPTVSRYFRHRKPSPISAIYRRCFDAFLCSMRQSAVLPQPTKGHKAASWRDPTNHGQLTTNKHPSCAEAGRISMSYPTKEREERGSCRNRYINDTACPNGEASGNSNPNMVYVVFLGRLHGTNCIQDHAKCSSKTRGDARAPATRGAQT